jgi:hypothetical protein
MIEDKSIENAWYAARYQDLPAAAEQQLKLASLAYQDSATAEMHLAIASAIAPNNAVVLVGEYRYFFYKNRLHDALKTAKKCLIVVAVQLQIPANWQDVSPQHANFSGDDAAYRFYLFVLKAYAYLLLRLNQLTLGAVAAEKLLELDPHNKVGGQVLLDVLQRIGKDDYDD